MQAALTIQLMSELQWKVSLLVNEVMKVCADSHAEHLQLPSQHLSSLKCFDLLIKYFFISLFDLEFTRKNHLSTVSHLQG